MGYGAKKKMELGGGEGGGKKGRDTYNRRAFKVPHFLTSREATGRSNSFRNQSVNNRLSNQSERDIKECPQAPFLSFSPPYRAPQARLADFSFSLFTGYSKLK